MKTAKTTKKRREKSRYDSAWKDVIEELFEPFMELFFPHAHGLIDFSKGCVFITKELRKIVPESKTGKRFPDGVVKVHLNDGSVECVCLFIHIEVEGKKEDNFPERMYVYNYRIYDQNREKGVEVVSFAVLTDEDENYRPDEFSVSRLGFELRMKFPMVKIIDYKNDPEKRAMLEKSDNPVAMVVRAVLKSFEVKRSDDDKRSEVKLELLRECYKRGYEKSQRATLLKAIDWVIRIPDRYQKKISDEILKLEEEYKMPYVTSWERIARKEGRKEGRMEGKREGKMEGIVEGKRETARQMLNDGVTIEKIVKYTGLTEKEVKALMH